MSPSAMHAFQACYRSRPAADPMAAILDIVRASEVNNFRMNVSGILYYGPTMYLQMLEGPEAGVLTVLDMIREDTRHRMVWEVTRPAARRHFRTALPMGYIDDRDLKSFAETGGVPAQVPEFAKHDVDKLVQVLVTAGRQKYPSMSTDLRS